MLLAFALANARAEGAEQLNREHLHPNSQSACQGTGVIPERFRVDSTAASTAAGRVATDTRKLEPGRIVVLDQGSQLLLLGNRTIAVVSAPVTSRGGGAIQGLTSRAFGGDLIREQRGKNSDRAWEVCVGTERTIPESCSPAGAWIDNRNMPATWSIVEDESGSIVRFTWVSESLDIEIEQDLMLRNGRLSARLSARSNSLTKGIVAARFPLVRVDYGTGQAASGELILPRGNLGIKCHDCRQFQAIYPTIYQTMPWFGVIRGDHGLYVGAHDPKGRMKRVVVDGPKSQSVSYFEIYPEASGIAGNILDPDWYFEVAPICAKRGWPALAHLYKEWTTAATDWGRAPRLIDRSDIPRDVRDGAWWFNYSISRNAGIDVLVKRTIRDQVDFQNIPTVHHWYGWHDPGMDRGFPTHRPKNGTREGILEIQKNPLSRILLYTNATHSDQSSAPIFSGRPMLCQSSASQFPQYWEDTIRGADGSRIFSSPSTGTCLALMDLTSEHWRAVVHSNSDLVTNQLGADGVYLDVIGNVREGSWTEERHSPGRGEWVTRSARELVASISKRPQLVVVEGALEQMTGISDAGVNYLGTPVEMIPLFPVVYHERFILAGLRSLPPDDRDALRIKNGLAFVWGLQPGLNSLQWHGPDRAANVAWAIKLGRARRQLSNWLAYGEYLGPIDQVDDADTGKVKSRSWSTLTGNEKPVEFRRNQIEAGLYRGSDGGYSIILINLGERDTVGKLVIPTTLLGSRVRLFSASGRSLHDDLLEPMDGILTVSVPKGGILRAEFVFRQDIGPLTN